MKILTLLLMIIGILGLLLSSMMFGDIGIAAALASVTAILAGIGFYLINKKISIINKNSS